jgi:hypothetical protein
MRETVSEMKWICFALLLGSLAASGVSGAQPVSSQPGPQVSVVVLDFTMAPRVAEKRDERRRLQYSDKPVETEKDRRGWWFGSNDVYYNSNMASIAGDLFEEKLRDCGAFRMYSRQDLRLYYADKKDFLKKKMTLDEKQAAKSIEMLNPVSIGRELGVDKVVTGYICDSEFRKNRTFGPFASVSSFTVSVYDTRTGNLEFTKNYGGHDMFASQYTHFERRAERFVRDFLSGKGRP